MTTTLKTCFKCGAEKPLASFYKHPEMADGHVNKCKECNKLDNRINRHKNVEYYREYDRKRGNRQTKEYRQAYTERYAEKYKARYTMKNAIRDGRLIKLDHCEGCGGNFHIEGHHEDYSKPLEVIWLCSACHSFVHSLELFK